MTAKQVSHYRIISKLGAGGMGEVYLAEDTRLDRKVALKLLPKAYTEDADRVRRFMQEAKAASALNHPNIITVYDLGESEEGRFIVMELVAGRTLRAAIAEDHTVGTLLGLGSQIAKALSAAHAAGITHRDIKPENIMVRDDGYVKILDFGLARLLPTTASAMEADTLTKQTIPGTLLGTVAYMSPEQARGAEVSHPSDIFALGIVLYEWATGQHPFKSETMVAYLNAITLQTPPPLIQRRPEIPAALDALILRMLEKEEGKRPAASEVAQALQEMERHTPSTPIAVPEQPLPVRRPAGSRTLLWSVLLGVLLLTGAGLWRTLRSAGKTPIESIAVLPFVNEGGNADVEYLSDGMTESLISSLSQLPNLNVKARASVFRYKGKELDVQKAAQELKVQAILTGRVVQRGDLLTLSLELVDAKTENALWSERYSRQQSDLVALQSEIARDVSGKLRVKLSGGDEQKLARKYTQNPEAYRLYLQGRFYWNKRDGENIKKAMEQFRAAVGKDPSYALAYAGLADCYALLEYYVRTPSSESLPQAKAYATRALEMDDSLAEAHASLGLIQNYLWNWTESEKEFKRAIDRNPRYPTAHQWYSRYLRAMGRSSEALAEIQRAQDLDPLSLVINDNLAQIFLEQGEVKATIEQCKKMIELDPNYWGAHHRMTFVYLKQARNAEALAEAQRTVESLKGASMARSLLGYVQAVSGKRNEALAVVRELEENYAKQQADGLDVAKVFAGLGEKDRAFAWLEKDFQARSSSLVETRLEPALESLRGDPRFASLLRRMGLPQ